MKKFSLFILALLCLCANAWAYVGSDPRSGGSFYIYHPYSGKFLSSQASTGTDKMKAVSAPELWVIENSNVTNGVATVNMYHIVNSTRYYFNLSKSNNSANPNISTKAETIQLSQSTTNTDLVAYKIHRTADPARYLNYSGSFSGAVNTGEQNDWVFITQANYPAFIEELRSPFLPSTSGWSKITAMPTNPAQYYYCLVDDKAKVMLSLQTASNNGGSNKAAFYKTFADPLSDATYLWEFAAATQNSAGYYTIQNKSMEGKYMYSPDGSEYLFYTNGDQTSETSHHTFLIVYADGSWTITNSDYLNNEGEDAKHIGLWTPGNGYEDGQELAANKNTADAAHFQIYAIKKTDITDLDDKMVEDKSGWNCVQGNGPNYYNNTGATETYLSSGKFQQGKIMYQTISGLDAGTYMVEFYAIVNSANGVTSESGNGYAHVYANTATQGITLIAQNGCTPTDYLHSLMATVGNDGNLEFGVYCDDAGGNWCVVRVKSLTKLQTGDDISDMIFNRNINQTHNSTNVIPDGWIAFAHSGGNGTYSKASSGDTYLEYYNDNHSSNPFNVDYYQTVTLNAGTYRLTADLFFNGDVNAVGLYAYFNGATHSTPVNISGSDFNNYSLDFSLSEATTVNVGVKVLTNNPSGTWMGADNFKLYYIGAPNKTKTLTSSYGMLYNQKYDILIDDNKTYAYYATYNSVSNEVTLTEVLAGATNKVIPAGSVVLLHNTSSASSIQYRYVAAGSAVTIPAGNCFYHHDNATDDNYVNYVLGEQGGVVAFHKFTGNEADLDGYNVLRLPASSLGGNGNAPSIIRIVTEENTATALVPVYEEHPATAATKANGVKQLINGHLYILQGDAIYDMLGRKIR